MAKGNIIVTGDPNIKAGEYEVCADGEHQVNGFTYMIPKDKTEPMYVEQQGKLVVRIKLSKVDGTEGPAYSATPAQLFALVSAFGATLPKISAENRMTTRSLIALKQALDNVPVKKVLTVSSKNGWVNRIDEATPPKDLYTVRFVEAHRSDYEPGSLEWYSTTTKKGGTMTYLMAEFEIVGDKFGKPSVWDGYQFGVMMYKPFITEPTVIGDETLTPTDVPMWTKTPKGAIPTNVLRWQGFIQHFTVNLEDHDWQTDAQLSEYGVNEVVSPQYIIFGNAFKNRKTRSVLAVLSTRESGQLSMDLNDLIPNEDSTEEEPQASELYALIEMIEKLAGKDAFVQSTDNAVVFSDTGRAWAKKTFGEKNGPWERAGMKLEDHRPLHKLTSDECKRLLEELVGQFETTTPEEVSKEPW